MSKTSTKQVLYFYMKENGELKKDSDFPKDGKRHEAIVVDEVTGQSDKFDVIIKPGGPIFYTKHCGLKVELKGNNFINYTSRKFNKQLHKTHQKTFDEATVDFLKSICPDFDMVQKMIDTDLIVLPTEVTEIKTVKKKRKKGEGGESERKVIETVKTVNMWNMNVDSGDKVRILKGDFQSRKSWATTAVSLYYLLHARISTFIVVQNSLDACDQLLKRVKEVFNNYVTHVENEDLRDKFDKLFQVLDIQRGKKADENQIREAMNGINPKIFIILRNAPDLKYINETIGKCNPKRYVTIIDESDENDSGIESLSQDEMNIFKENAKLIWDVTATPLTNLMKDDIEKGNVGVLSRPEGYKGLPTVNFRDLKKDAEYCSKVEDNPFEKDKNLKDYIRDFAKTKPFKCSFYGQRHPRYALVRTGNTIQPQLKIASYVYSHYGSRIVSITYNGSSEGITMRGTTLPKTPITLARGSGREFSSTIEGDIHKFPGCHIGKVIAWLQSNGGVEKYPRIMVLAGKMADRGISFGGDNYSECFKDKKLCWHISEMYFIAPKSMNQANLLQAAGRICGVFPDSVPLTLYTNSGRDIVNAYWAQEELIERARKQRNHKRIQKMLMSEALEEVEIQKDKCVKGRRWVAKGTAFQPNKVKDDSKNGGWDWKAEGKTYDGKEATFGEGARVETAKKVLSEEKVLEIREKVKEKKKEDAGKLIARNTDQLDLINKHLTGNKATSIAIFLASLDVNTSYTRLQLEDLLFKANYQQPKSIFISVTKPTSNWGPGCLFDKKDGKYKLKNNLRSAWLS